MVWNATHYMSGNSPNTSEIFSPKFPLWLGSGSHDIIASTGYWDSGGGTYVFTRNVVVTFSAIEFNVIP